MYLYNYAQISESFKDTSVTLSSITWYGQVNDFKINAEHQLQSIGNINGASTLYTSLQASSAMEWELWVKLNFAPSESNRVRIYIQSNDSIFSNGNASTLPLSPISI